MPEHEGQAKRLGPGLRLLVSFTMLLVWFELLLYAGARGTMITPIVRLIIRFLWPVMRVYLSAREWSLAHPVLAGGLFVCVATLGLLAYRSAILFYYNQVKPRLAGIMQRPEEWVFPMMRFDLYEMIRGRPKGQTFIGMTPVRSRWLRRLSWEPVYLPEKQRTMHIQCIGRTGSGKTASVIWPSVLQDCLDGKGVCVIDGKGSDENILAMKHIAASAGRAKDLRIFALPAMTAPSMFSMAYNLVYVRPHRDGVVDGDVQAMAERVFAALPLGNNQYYNNLAYIFFVNLCRVLYGIRNPVDPSTGLLFNVVDILSCLKGVAPSILYKGEKEAKGANRRATVDANGSEETGDWQAALEFALANTADSDAADNIRSQIARLGRDIHQALSGLVGVLDRFQAPILNSYNPDVVIADVVEKNLILYCQLPANMFKIQAPALAKVLLMDLQQEGSLRQVYRHSRSQEPFAVTIDEFARFAERSFLDSLGQLRDANFEFLLAHQSPADVEAVSKEFAASVWDNTRTKIILNQSNPQLCETIAKSVGTVNRIEHLVRRVEGPLYTSLSTGDVSAKLVDAYRLHPNAIKNLQPVGQGYLYAVDKVLPLVLAPMPMEQQDYALPVNHPRPELGLNLATRAKAWKAGMGTQEALRGAGAFIPKDPGTEERDTKSQPAIVLAAGSSGAEGVMSPEEAQLEAEERARFERNRPDDGA